MSGGEEKRIFIDTDFLSCFLSTDELKLVLQLYPDYRILVPEHVCEEFRVYLRSHVEVSKRWNLHLGNDELSKAEPIYAGTEEHGLYMRLTTLGLFGFKPIGSGEAEAITLAHLRGGVLASNNLRDVSPYVSYYRLEHITTSEIIYNSWQKGFLSDDRAKEIWIALVELERKMPYNTFDEYCKSREE